MAAAADVATCHIQEESRLHSKPLSMSLFHLIQLSVSSLNSFCSIPFHWISLFYFIILKDWLEDLKEQLWWLSEAFGIFSSPLNTITSTPSQRLSLWLIHKHIWSQFPVHLRIFMCFDCDWIVLYFSWYVRHTVEKLSLQPSDKSCTGSEISVDGALLQCSEKAYRIYSESHDLS